MDCMILAYAYHFRFLLRQPDLHCNIHNFFHTVGSYGYSFHVCATDVPTGNAVANWYSGVSFVRSAYISWCNSIRTPGAFAPGVLMLMYILLRGLDSTNLTELDSCILMKVSGYKIRISRFKTMLGRVKSFNLFLSADS